MSQVSPNRADQCLKIFLAECNRMKCTHVITKMKDEFFVAIRWSTFQTIHRDDLKDFDISGVDIVKIMSAVRFAESKVPADIVLSQEGNPLSQHHSPSSSPNPRNNSPSPFSTPKRPQSSSAHTAPKQPKVNFDIKAQGIYIYILLYIYIY